MSRTRWVVSVFVLTMMAAGIAAFTGRVTIADLTGALRRANSSEQLTSQDSVVSEGRPRPLKGDLPPGAVITEGRVASYPGASVIVGAEYTGTLIEVNVLENEKVKKGDVIARMRSDDLRASREMAEADLAEATAEVSYWERELARLEALDRRNASPKADLDMGRRSLAVMRARQARARATIAQANAELLDKTRILAPIDGTIVTRSAHPGETLTIGAQIFKLVDLSRTRIETEVDEYDVGKVTLGTPCVITAEGYPGQSWAGTVEELPADVIPRKIRPEDPARPADTRVVLVKVAFTEEVPLKLGQRVYVSVRREKSGSGSLANPDGP